MMNDGPATLEALVTNEKVQKVISESIFVEEQIVKSIKDLVTLCLTKMFISMPIDSKIDAIF
jgi:hypothetical protein